MNKVRNSIDFNQLDKKSVKTKNKMNNSTTFDNKDNKSISISNNKKDIVRESLNKTQEYRNEHKMMQSIERHTKHINHYSWTMNNS